MSRAKPLFGARPIACDIRDGRDCPGCERCEPEPGASAKPIVKWVGGKTRLLPEIVARLPPRDQWSRYIEPFAGGASLFFHLAPERAILADANADLILMYEMVKTRPEMVIRHLARLAASHITDPEFYYKVREGWNSDRTVSGKRSTVDLRAAMFIYLNRTCFNGLWRVNNAGEFNVPRGKYEHPLICDPEAIWAASLCLGHASTVCDGYSAMHDAGWGDLVYLDPPYDPVSKTSDFTGYTSGGFGAADQMKVAAAVRLMVERGAKVIASNSDTWFIRDLYKGFRIDRVQRPGTMNSVAAKRGAVKEVLIMAGYDPPRRKRARARG